MSNSKTVVVTGATGFIGRAVCRELVERGWAIVVVSRDPERARSVIRNAAGYVGYAGDALEQAVIAQGRVIRLAGENPLAHRWTRSFKARMWASRVDETARIATALARRNTPGSILVSASGINIHAPSPDRLIVEDSPTQSNWIGRMIAAKEVAAQPAIAAGARVVELRIGIAIGPGGGPLSFIDRPFRRGFGGYVGDGRQYVPWLHIDDMVAMIVTAFENEGWHGPIIAAAPNPVRARDFAAAIGLHLGRPSWLHMPAPVARLALGEVATLVLSSYRADPGKALRLGFRFRYAELGAALAAIYGAALPSLAAEHRRPALG
jgi:uncharacterized protein (TIGR01777 family)